MADIVDCPSCRAKLRVPDALRSSPVQCPTCTTRFIAPAEAPDLEAADASEPPPIPQPSVVEPPASKPNYRDLGVTPRSAVDEAIACPACGARTLPTDDQCPTCGVEFEDEEFDEDLPGPIRRDAEPHRGTLILTLGIVSIVAFPFMCFPVGMVLGVGAWVRGHADLVKMRQQTMDVRGQGVTQAGMICGIVGTALNSLWLLFCGGAILLMIWGGP